MQGHEDHFHDQESEIICTKCNSSLHVSLGSSNVPVTQKELQEILQTSMKLLEHAQAGQEGEKVLNFTTRGGEKVTISSKLVVESGGDVFHEVRHGDKIYTMGPDGQLQLNEKVIKYNVIRDKNFVPDASYRVYVPPRYEDLPPIPATPQPAERSSNRGSNRGSVSGRKEHMEAQVQVTVEKPAAPAPQPSVDPRLLETLERLRKETQASRQETQNLRATLGSAKQSNESAELNAMLARQAEELRALQAQLLGLAERPGAAQPQPQLQLQRLFDELAQGKARLEAVRLNPAGSEAELRRLEDETRRGFADLSQLIAQLQGLVAQGAQSRSSGAQSMPDLGHNFQMLGQELARLRAELADLRSKPQQQKPIGMTQPIEIVTTEVREKTIEKNTSSYSSSHMNIDHHSHSQYGHHVHHGHQDHHSHNGHQVHHGHQDHQSHQSHHGHHSQNGHHEHQPHHGYHTHQSHSTQNDSQSHQRSNSSGVAKSTQLKLSEYTLEHPIDRLYSNAPQSVSYIISDNRGLSGYGFSNTEGSSQRVF